MRNHLWYLVGLIYGECGCEEEEVQVGFWRVGDLHLLLLLRRMAVDPHHRAPFAATPRRFCLCFCFYFWRRRVSAVGAVGAADGGPYRPRGARGFFAVCGSRAPLD